MKHVYTSQDLAQATLIKSVLKAEGIESLIKNEILSGGMSMVMGDTTIWPEVWILNDELEGRAKIIVDDWQNAEQVK